MTSPLQPVISPTDLFDKPAGGGGGGSNLRGLLLSAIVPFIAYTVLTGQGVAEVPALIVSGLFSLLAPRPPMFYFGRQFASGGDPARAAA